MNQPDKRSPPKSAAKTFSIRSLFALMLFAAIVFAASLHWKLVVIGLALVLGGCRLWGYRLLQRQRRLLFTFLMIWIGAILIATGLGMFLFMLVEDTGPIIREFHVIREFRG